MAIVTYGLSSKTKKKEAPKAEKKKGSWIKYKGRMVRPQGRRKGPRRG